MELVKQEGIYKLKIFQEETSKHTYREINYITAVKGWEKIIDQIIYFCSGKLSTSTTSWLSRFNSILKPTIKDSYLKSFPKRSREWNLLLKNIYLTTLCTDAIKSSIETRVAIWNKNLYPFFIFLQDRDQIPIDVIIPIMKDVDQVEKNSSFNISIVGENEPYKVTHKDSLDRLIVPVSLSRTDVEYLDELYYDIERKRNKLHECLTSYWKNIRDHFLLGRKLIKEVDIESIKKRIKNEDFYISVPRPQKNLPNFKKHFASFGTIESFGTLLYCLKDTHGHAKFKRDSSFLPTESPLIERHRNFLPTEKTLSMNREFYDSIMPKGHFEIEENSLLRRFNWMLGCLDHRTISSITALLIMENPKFTVHALFDSKVEDKSGKQILTVGEHDTSFSVNKQRAKKVKKESLSDLSLEIISLLIEMRKDNLHSIPKNLSKRLFIIRSAQLGLSAPTPQMASRFISGARHNGAAKGWFGSYFPSLEKAGIKRNTINHKKIRNTEGVLEFFRTGSVKAVARKLGNTQRVVLQHYLSKPLIAAYSTRQVRRFQNLIIVAACATEDYLLKAVDFNNLSELHNFIHDMLELDANGTNPLLKYLRENMGGEQNLREGDLIANISEKSLSYLYVYHMTAELCNISADTPLSERY